MFINLRPGANGVTQSDPAKLIDLAARHGFGGLDLPGVCLGDDAAADAAASLIAETDLRWGLFAAPEPFRENAELGELLERIDAAAGRAARAGCVNVYNHVWSSHPERRYEENMAWHVERLKRAAEIYGRHGIRYGLEFLGPRHLLRMHAHPFIHTLDGLLELIDRAGAGPHIGLAVDMFHNYTSGLDAAQLARKIAGRRIVVVHANDAMPGRTPAEQIDGERALPLATGVIDGAAQLRAVADAGFDGPVFAEPFQPDTNRLKAMDDDDAAAEVADCMERLFNAAGIEVHS